MIIRVLATEMRTVKDGEEIRETPKLVNRASVNMEKRPDKIHAKMKQTEAQLDALKSCERVNILCP